MAIRHDLLMDEENELITRLLKLRRDKQRRNRLRNEYYDGKVRVKNLGIAIPDNCKLELRKITNGWGAKAVNGLAARSRFDGFIYSGIDDDPLAEIVRANNFLDLYRQAVISQLTNSCAFITVSSGSDGEPPVMFHAYDATQAAAIWDARMKRIKAGIVITDFGKTREIDYPKSFILHTAESSIECEYTDSGWGVSRFDHNYGRPLMEAIVYNPSLRKPFGTSRITRAVMSIIDRAMRTAMLTDLAEEFFAAPQKALLGADKDVLDGKSKWDAYIGSIFAVSKDEDGNIPKFEQLPQGTLTPLTEQLRNLAGEFSGETSIPVASLGVTFDNPSSAEGIHATKEDLIMEAESLNTTNSGSLKNIGLLALAILQGVDRIDSLSPELLSITPKFKSPARPTMVSQSDAIVKQVTAIPWIADTSVALEELGYTNEQIMRMKSERVGANAAQTFVEMASQVMNNAD